jgi:hypothetical protein
MTLHEGGTNEVRLEGHLDTRWAARLGGLSLRHGSDGATTLHGPVVDQSALDGLLSTVRTLGVPLIAITQIDRESPNT